MIQDHPERCPLLVKFLLLSSCLHPSFLPSSLAAHPCINYFYPEDGSDMFLRNFGNYLENYTASQLGTRQWVI
jgi:hypothetical protein